MRAGGYVLISDISGDFRQSKLKIRAQLFQNSDLNIQKAINLINLILKMENLSE